MSPKSLDLLEPDSLARLQGLKSAPELNGVLVKIVKYLPDRERYLVDFPSGERKRATFARTSLSPEGTERCAECGASEGLTADHDNPEDLYCQKCWKRYDEAQHAGSCAARGADEREELAREALRKHAEWKAMDELKRALRSAMKAVSDKLARAALWRRVANAPEGCGEEEEGQNSDLLGLDLPAGQEEDASSPVDYGRAFVLNGAFTLADNIEQQRGAAIAAAEAEAAEVEADAAAETAAEAEAAAAELEGAVMMEAEPEAMETEEEAEPGAAAEDAGASPGEEGSSWPDLLRSAAGGEPSAPGGVGAGAAAGADAAGAGADDTDADDTDAEGTDDADASAEDLFGEADEHTLAPADTPDTPAGGAIPIAVAGPGPSAVAAVLPPPSRHARPEELDALAAAARPAARLSVDAGGVSDVNDASSLLRLDGLCFALILLHSSPESATVLATGVCRRLRQEHEQLYRRYCRVAVRRLERKSSRVNNGVPLSELAPSDAVPAAQLTGPARWAGDGLSAEVWAEVQALVGEARATSFLLSDACAEEEAPWRLRTAVATLRNEAKTGAYQVQTFAAPPDKLVVVAENFNALAEEDKQLLLESGVVRRVETRVGATCARVTITPSAKPAPKPIAADVDLSSQLAACQQQEKVLHEQLDEIKMRVRTYWSPGKVVVPGEGSVTLAKGGSTGHLRVTYTCAGEAAFRATLDKKDRKRLAVAFRRPAPRLHVRGNAVGDEHGNPRMTMKESGRALMASMGGVGGEGEAEGGQSLPTHAVAARRGDPTATPAAPARAAPAAPAAPAAGAVSAASGGADSVRSWKRRRLV